MNINGTIMGYDPGGNKNNGVAFFTYENSILKKSKIDTIVTAEYVIKHARCFPNLLAIGIDTLTCWSTGESGWRPADRCLKKRHPEVTKSILAPNSLYGAMAINGMAVLIKLRKYYPSLCITETHPKVLYHALTGQKYDYERNRQKMDKLLTDKLETTRIPENEHEWDATISVYAALQGMRGNWTIDLHTLPPSENEQLIKPCGETHYWWPKSNQPKSSPCNS